MEKHDLVDVAISEIETKDSPLDAKSATPSPGKHASSSLVHIQNAEVLIEKSQEHVSSETVPGAISEIPSHNQEMCAQTPDLELDKLKDCETEVKEGVILNLALDDTLPESVTINVNSESISAINTEDLGEALKDSERVINKRINRRNFNEQHAVYNNRCPITSEVMLNPVIADDGVTYERAFIEEWFAECAARGLPFTSPATAEIVQPILTENHEMKGKHGSENIDKTDLNDTYSIHMLRAVFAELDPLREFLSETLREWQPPQFVVIGQESSGKSTLLERLSAMPIFPHDESCCTRMPLHVHLRHSDRFKAPTLEVFNIATNVSEEGPFIVPMRWAALDVKQKMFEILEDEGNQHGVSTTRIIILTIAGPRMPSIDLVDMPGLVSSPSDLKDQTRLLVQQHILRREKHSLFLVTVPGDTAPNTSIAMELIQEMSLQEKTLGVFTMCDDIPLRKRDLFKERLRQLSSGAVTGANVIHNCWVATMNAPNHIATDARAKIEQQAKAENEFFSNHMPDLDLDYVSCKALVSRMNAMYVNHLKETWAPATIDLIECACETAQGQSAKLGLPDFHGNIDGARDLAVIEARVILGTGLSNLVQDCCRLILKPLQDTLTEQMCETVSFSKPELVSGWIFEQKSLVLAVCNKAASEIEPLFLSGLQTLLMNSESNSFCLTRFPDFVDAIIVDSKSVLKQLVESLCSTFSSCTNTFFGEMSPWISIKTRADGNEMSVNVRCKCDVLVDNIGFSFIRHLPCQNLIDAISVTGSKIQNWVESCQDERAELHSRLDRLKAAEKGIASLLGLDLSAMLESRQKERIKKAIASNISDLKALPESEPRGSEQNAAQKKNDCDGKVVPVSMGSQGRKRRSCIKADSAKETKAKKPKQGLEQTTAVKKLKKTRLDFTEAV